MIGLNANTDAACGPITRSDEACARVRRAAVVVAYRPPARRRDVEPPVLGVDGLLRPPVVPVFANDLPPLELNDLPPIPEDLVRVDPVNDLPPVPND